MTPGFLAKCLLLVYALAILVVMSFGADALDVLVMGVILGVPWLVAPVALPALLAANSSEGRKRWLYFALEVAVICSTIACFISLARNPDAQNGIAVLFLPALQFGGIAIALLVLALIERLRGHRPEARLP